MAVERSFRISYEPITLGIVGIKAPLYIFGGPVEDAKTRDINDKFRELVEKVHKNSPELRNLWEIRLSPDEIGYHSIKIGKINMYSPLDIKKDANRVRVHVELYSLKGFDSPWQELIYNNSNSRAVKENILLGIAYAGNKLQEFGHEHWGWEKRVGHIPFTLRITTKGLNLSAEDMLKLAVKDVYHFEVDKSHVANNLPQGSSHSATAGKLFYL